MPGIIRLGISFSLFCLFLFALVSCGGGDPNPYEVRTTKYKLGSGFGDSFKSGELKTYRQDGSTIISASIADGDHKLYLKEARVVFSSSCGAKFGKSDVTGSTGIFETTYTATEECKQNGTDKVYAYAKLIDDEDHVSLSAEGTVSAEEPESDSPVQSNLSISLSSKNPEAWEYDDEEVEVSIFALDDSSNPVADKTTVEFTAKGGRIGSQCETTNGRCSVNWISLGTRPDNGRVTITAEIPGIAVSAEEILVMSGSNNIDINFEEEGVPVRSVDVSLEKSPVVTISLSDKNGQPPPKGTIVSLSPGGVQLVPPTDKITIPSTNANKPFTIDNVRLRYEKPNDTDDDNAPPFLGTLNITVTTPRGVISSGYLDVNVTN